MSTPANLPPLPTGSFNLGLTPPSESNAKCLTNPSQGQAWMCTPGSFMYLNVTPSDGDTTQVTLSNAFGRDDPSLPYGPLTPHIDKSVGVTLMYDKDNPEFGPAYFFQTQYTKVVVLPDYLFNGTTATSAKRSVDEGVAAMQLDRRSIEGRDVPHPKPGEKPWYCYWNDTVLEGFIYVTQDTNGHENTQTPTVLLATNTLLTGEMASPTSTGPPQSGSTTPAPAASTGSASGSSPSSSPPTGSTSTQPGPTGPPPQLPTGAPGGPDGHPPSGNPPDGPNGPGPNGAVPHRLLKLLRREHHKHSRNATNSTGSASATGGSDQKSHGRNHDDDSDGGSITGNAFSGGGGGGGSGGGGDGSGHHGHDGASFEQFTQKFVSHLYPKTVKLAERRGPQSATRPYCQQMLVNDDKSVVPALDGGGKQIVSVLDENEPVAQERVAYLGANKGSVFYRRAMQEREREREVEKRQNTGNDNACLCEWLMT